MGERNWTPSAHHVLLPGPEQTVQIDGDILFMIDIICSEYALGLIVFFNFNLKWQEKYLPWHCWTSLPLPFPTRCCRFSVVNRQSAGSTGETNSLIYKSIQGQLKSQFLPQEKGFNLALSLWAGVALKLICGNFTLLFKCRFSFSFKQSYIWNVPAK